MTTLKDMFEVYRPKSPDEQKFVDKHVTIKHKDRNEVNGKANGDDVFKATNIKTIDREGTRHGYDVGADEKVYEENEFVNEDDLIDEGFISKMFKKKPKVTVKVSKVEDLPDGEKPFQKATGQGTRKPQPVQRDSNGDTLYQRVQKARGMKEDVEEINEKDSPKPPKMVRNPATGRMAPEGSFLINRKPVDHDAGKPLINRKPDNKGIHRLSGNKNASSELTKEEIINRTIEKYMPEVADIKPLTMEQRLAKKLDGLSENQTALLFSLFANLNEDNQLKMLVTCEDMEGINQLIDFAIENSRGE